MGKIELGGDCNEDSACIEGLECLDGTCVQYVEHGEICDVNEEELICGTPSGDGEYECESGMIYNNDDMNKGICVKYVDHGEECNDDYDGDIRDNDTPAVKCKTSFIGTGIYECIDNEDSILGGRCEITAKIVLIYLFIFIIGVIIILFGVYIIGFILVLCGYTNNFFIEISSDIVTYFTGTNPTEILTNFFNTNTGGGIQGEVTAGTTRIENPVGNVGNVGNVETGIVN